MVLRHSARKYVLKSAVVASDASYYKAFQSAY